MTSSWFRQSFSTEQVTSCCLNQWLHCLLTHIGVTRCRWVNMIRPMVFDFTFNDTRAYQNSLSEAHIDYLFPLNVTMTSSNGNIFRVTSPLCVEFTGHRWFPLTKANDAEVWCFLWSAEHTVELTWALGETARWLQLQLIIVIMAAADRERISIFPLVCPDKAHNVSFSAPDI